MWLTCHCIRGKIGACIIHVSFALNLLAETHRLSLHHPLTPISSHSPYLLFPLSFIFLFSLHPMWVLGLDRMRCSPSPSSPGREWDPACWMAAQSGRGESWFWRECQPSSTVPCIAARPRILWAPRIHTLASSSLVHMLSYTPCAHSGVATTLAVELKSHLVLINYLEDDE